MAQIVSISDALHRNGWLPVKGFYGCKERSLNMTVQISDVESGPMFREGCFNFLFYWIIKIPDVQF